MKVFEGDFRGLTEPQSYLKMSSKEEDDARIFLLVFLLPHITELKHRSISQLFLPLTQAKRLSG